MQYIWNNETIVFGLVPFQYEILSGYIDEYESIYVYISVAALTYHIENTREKEVVCFHFKMFITTFYSSDEASSSSVSVGTHISLVFAYCIYVSQDTCQG